MWSKKSCNYGCSFIILRENCVVHKQCKDNMLHKSLLLSWVNVDIRAEQCFVIHFCCRLKKLCLESLRMLNEEYGDEVFGNSTNQRWHAAFIKECKSADLIPHRGQLSTCTEKKVNSVSTVKRSIF